jgi:glycosyltransferase involved in cell wall biosynthesis
LGKERKMDDKPLVSVVIPTFNSERYIGKCLQSVRNQTYDNIEILVVDKNSEDKTVEISKRYGAKVIIGDLDLSASRNRGIREARGRYLLSIDSDMELTLRIIEECLEVVNCDENIGGVIIPEKSVGNSFWVKVRDFERSFYEGTEIESARFFRKDLVEKVDAFDEDIVFFEDSTLPQKIEKLGYNVKARINGEIQHHETNFSLWTWLKKKYYYGKTAQKYKEKHKEYGKKQMSMLYRYGLFFRDRRFYSKPLSALGVIILKTLEFFSAGLGYLGGNERG